MFLSLYPTHENQVQVYTETPYENCGFWSLANQIYLFTGLMRLFIDLYC